VQETEGLSARLLISVSCQLVKSIGMCRNINLQLLLIEYGLKPNAFKIILEFSEKDILCITFAYKLIFLYFLACSLYRW
jgi:hypothetical protein